MSKIICLVKEPTMPIKWATVDNELHTFQSIVDGFIEVVYINKHLAVICNEEGRIERKPYCCTIDGVHYVGTVILVGVDGEEFADLNVSVKDIAEYIPADDKYEGDIWDSWED